MEVIFKLTDYLRQSSGKLEAMQELSSVFDIPYQDQIDDAGQLVSAKSRETQEEEKRLHCNHLPLCATPTFFPPFISLHISSFVFFPRLFFTSWIVIWIY